MKSQYEFWMNASKLQYAAGNYECGNKFALIAESYKA
jgi:hypothetical protein